MTLKSGTTLGPYEITGAIGAGGMGEVYQAHDTKLGRDVAIKVLPEAFAHDPDRLSRFQREAKMLAALNHPNIATIYGLEQSNGTSYLVMELVSGETLQQRVARDGRLPIEEALGICRQMAEALETAHEKGIIHRDLKPANVKVTLEGKIKVLDFGLAKAFVGGETGSDPSNSPTLSAAGTMQGVILGTAAYMSPEQARGKAVNKATDIWAFGCVLYELLCGCPAFEGEDITEILAAVVKTDPDWDRLPEVTPAAIRVLLRRCLRKDQRQRLQDATDVRIEIQDALAAPSAGPMVTGPATRGWPQAVVVGLTALAVAGVTGLAVWNLKLVAPPTPRPVTRFTITLPPGQQLAGFDRGPAVALTPDGSRLAYVASQGDTQQLYLRPMDTLEARPVPGTEGAVGPFFSPDGQWLGFFAGGKLKKVSVSGGAALPLGDASFPLGASWGDEGKIAFEPATGSALQQVSDTGGAPQSLTRLAKGEVAHQWPEFLPGGKAVLFGASGAVGSEVAAQTIGMGDRRTVIQGGTQPRYARSGHLVYAQGGNLLAVPFDPQRLTVTGGVVPVVEEVAQSLNTDTAQYSISNTGSLVYVQGRLPAAQSRLVWVDRTGHEKVLSAAPRNYLFPGLSPDGNRVAVTVQDSEGYNIWVGDVDRDNLARRTFQGNANYGGVWTGDGKHIAFGSTKKEGSWNVFLQSADGSGGPDPLFTSENIQHPISRSPDGLLALQVLNPTTGWDILVLRISDHTVQPFLQGPANESGPRFSPDGHWLAYVSDELGRSDTYVRPYPPGRGEQQLISTEGGTEPVWNRNGRELFYRSGNDVMAVDITTQPSFVKSKPRRLFGGPYLPNPFASSPNYDVSPDGQRFLMVKPTEQGQAAPTQINVVLNWTEELKQKVPVGSKK